MASFNKVIIVGNLTRDPELKQQGVGNSVCKISLASNRQYKNKQGSMTQEVCYIDVDVWGVQAENCKQYLQKGRPVLVEGRLKLDTWETEGKINRKHLIVADRVVFLGSSNQQSESGMDDNVFISGNSSKKSNDISFKDEAPFEDELPF